MPTVADALRQQRIWQDLVATAILDRFLQEAEIIEMNGKSFRLRNGNRKKKRPGKTDSQDPQSGKADSDNEPS
jgi:hypothetical protein